MKRYVATVLMLLYVAVWGMQKGKADWADYYLPPAPPAPLLKVANGYARQLAGFSLFVKVAIFTGGPLRGVDKMSYADSLAQNFDVMTDLYPEYIDSYHYSQSYLATISPEYARQTNILHDRAIAEHPDILYFPFFKAFNYYFYLDDPVKAAELFSAMSKHPDAPPWFGHFAGKLMARGGNLLAGRTMLQAMINSEKNDYVKNRYRRSLENVNKALKVQAALDQFRNEHGKDAESPQELIPDYLDTIPRLDDNAVYVWKPPLLRLEQPKLSGVK